MQKPSYGYILLITLLSIQAQYCLYVLAVPMTGGPHLPARGPQAGTHGASSSSTQHNSPEDQSVATDHGRGHYTFHAHINENYIRPPSPPHDRPGSPAAGQARHHGILMTPEPPVNPLVCRARYRYCRGWRAGGGREYFTYGDAVDFQGSDGKTYATGAVPGHAIREYKPGDPGSVFHIRPEDRDKKHR